MALPLTLVAVVTATTALFDAGERALLPTLVVVPTTGLRHVTISTLQDALDGALQGATRTRLAPIEGRFSECKTGLACLAREIRSDPELAKSLPLLLMISAQGFGDEGDRVIARLVDLQAASTMVDDVAASDAILASSSAVMVTSASQLRDLGQRFVESLRAPLESRALWGVLAFELDGLVPGSAVALDGRELGIVQGARARVTGIAERKRSVRVSAPKYLAYEAEVAPGMSVSVQLVRAPTPIVDRLSGTAWITAGAAAAASVALFVYGANSTDGYAAVCKGAPCSFTGFPRLIHPSVGEEGFGTGPLIVPLAWSLLAGATGIVATGLIANSDVEEDLGFWPYAIGLGAGAVAYGAGEVIQAGL